MPDEAQTQESLQAQIEALQAKLRDQAAVADTDQNAAPKVAVTAEADPSPAPAVVAAQASTGLQAGVPASTPALTPAQIAKREEPGFIQKEKLYKETVLELNYEYVLEGGVRAWKSDVAPFINVISETQFTLGNPENPTEVVDASEEPGAFERLRGLMQGIKTTFATFGLNLAEYKVFDQGNVAAAIKKHGDMWLIYMVDWRAPTMLRVDHPCYRWTQVVSTQPPKDLSKSINRLIEAATLHYSSLNRRKLELEEAYGLSLQNN